MWYVILGLTIGLVVLTIYLHAKKRYPQSLVVKTTASLGFVVLCVVTIWQSSYNRDFFAWSQGDPVAGTKTAWLLVTGLVFGMAGDVILGIRAGDTQHQHVLIAIGMTVFGLGHVMFLAALLSQISFTFFALIVALASAPLVILLKEKVVMRMDDMLLPSVLYMFVLSLVAAQAWFGFWFSGDEWQLMMAIGLTLFLLSDVILSFIYFAYWDEPFMETINLSLYYAAQLVIALSVLLL